MSSQERYNAPFPSRLRGLISEHKTTITALAATLKISRQAVSQYCDGTGQPNTEKLCLICNYFGVSADYLLGRTDEKTPNMDYRSICERTGLNENSVDILSKNRDFVNMKVADVINILLSDECFQNIEKGRKYRSIINLLSFFFSYSSSGVSHISVTEHGDFYETGTKIHACSTPTGTVWLNTIDIDTQMVENSVLLELNRALINLKQNLNEEGD